MKNFRTFLYKEKPYTAEIRHGGWWERILHHFDIGGVTLGMTVLLNTRCENYKDPIRKIALIEHELTHVKQYIDEGWKFYFKYFTGHAAHYEKEAEKVGKTRF